MAGLSAGKECCQRTEFMVVERQFPLLARMLVLPFYAFILDF